MIGIGIDLCEIARMERIIERHEGFITRYFTPEEQAYLSSRGKTMAQSMAAMFAAKEALLKAMGIGLNGGIALMDIGITHDTAQAPAYALTGEAKARLTAMGATRTFLTISHEAGVAAAVAVIE